jgi:hypothetical protein
MGPPIGASGARTGLVERSGRAIAAYQPAPSLSGDPGIAPEDLGEPPSDAPSVQLDHKFVAPEVSANSGAPSPATGPSREANQALARIDALSAEEKLALFS